MAAMRKRSATPLVSLNTRGAAKRYQWKNDSASWVPGAPTDTQTGGGNLRLDEAGGWITANKVSGVGQDEYGGLPRGHGAQPGPDGEATGQCARGDSSLPS